jgi:putative membrane protein
MFTDWILACLHHLAIFSLAGVIAAEVVLLSGAIDAADVRRLASVDAWYGLLAAAVILFGVSRVIWGAKGYEYYLANHVFWTKMALFLILGLLSIRPTLVFFAWKKRLKTDPDFAPPIAEAARMRTYLWIEVGVFLCIPIAAAAMARGYGV